jgi:hypothetical protein
VEKVTYSYCLNSRKMSEPEVLGRIIAFTATLPARKVTIGGVGEQ